MIKFKCESDNEIFELSDKELKNIRPVIDRSGKARLLINYFDNSNISLSDSHLNLIIF